MKKLKINIPGYEYFVHIQDGIIDKIGSMIKDIFKGKRICIITDGNVDKFYGSTVENSLKGEGFEVYKIVVEPGEKSKSFETLMGLYDKLIDFKITRSDLIVALGGGVVGDLSGFCAATYLRGIHFVQIPTSLLAQIDSSIGGKVAVDLPRGKNLVGSFYHPKAVFIDPNVLRTLDRRYLNDGMGELIKYSLIRDREMFKRLMEIEDYEELYRSFDSLIYRCCDIKRDIVERDEHDNGERMILNFGHTIGHSIEKLKGYSGISHGEAVAEGMYEITKSSERNGLTKEGTAEKIKVLLNKYGLQAESCLPINEELIESMAVDKKNRGNNINLILIKDIGESFIHKIPREEISSFLAES